MAKTKFTFGIPSFVNAVYQAVFGKNVPDSFLADREMYIEGMEKGKFSSRDVVLNIVLSDYIREKCDTDDKFLRLCFNVMGVKTVPQEEFEKWLDRFYTRNRSGVIKGLFLTPYWDKFCDKYEVSND